MACLLMIVFLFCAISKENVIFGRTFTENTAIEFMDNIEKKMAALTTTISNQDTKFVLIDKRLARIADQITILVDQKTVNSKLNKALDEQKTVNSKHNKALDEQKTVNSKLNKTLDDQAARLAEQKTIIIDLNKSLAEQRTVISKLNTTLEKQAARIGDQNIRIADQKTVISKLNTTLEKQAALIGEQSTRLAKCNATFEEQAAQIGNQNSIIGHLNSSLDKQTSRIAEQAAQIADMNIIIEQLNNSLAEEIAKHKKGPSLVNIALNKPAAQSSTLHVYSSTADRAVDGNNITYSQTTFRYTTHWWCVDLLQEYSISTINVNAITYDAFYSDIGYEVRLSSTGSCNRSGFNSATLCHTEPEVIKNMYSVTGCDDGRQMSGRYVFIGGQYSIRLYEVEIYSIIY